MAPASSPPAWLSVVRIIFLSFGALIAGGTALYLAWAWLSAPSWATVQGRIVQANIDRRVSIIHRPRNQGGDYRQILYSPDVVYHYRVGGRDYTGFGIGDGTDWNYTSQAAATAALAPYRSGSVTVHYDPADPERSALDLGLFASIPLVIGGIGLALLGIGYGLYRRERAASL